MIVNDPRQFRFVPGRMCLDPTDLTTAFPHGGQMIGSFSGLKLTITRRSEELTAEEYGGEVFESVITGMQFRIGGFARGYDADLLDTLFDDVTTTMGGNHKSPNIDYPGDTREGRLGSAKNQKLLFAADNAGDPSIIFYQAMPLIEEVAEMRMETKREYGYPVMWHATRHASLGVAMIDRIENLVIT